LKAELIKSYFPEISEKQFKQFEMLATLYADWNEKINVISRKDIDNIYMHHVLHALGIAKIIQFKPGTTILDVGTGGGFPGIPLAILFPETSFHLVDSIGKKITVVKAVAESCNLQNVQASHCRAEELKEKYDFIISRAVTRLKPFYAWVRDKVKPTSFNTLYNGILYLKGGDLEEELNELKKPYALYSLSDYFKEEFFETKKVVYVPL
jgi:16S rRNA (guanine527-N7)-methyltransferase